MLYVGTGKYYFRMRVVYLLKKLAYEDVNYSSRLCKFYSVCDQICIGLHSKVVEMCSSTQERLGVDVNCRRQYAQHFKVKSCNCTPVDIRLALGGAI